MQGGRRFVMRYLGDDDTGENLQRDELDQLHAAGLKVGLVFQTGSSFVLTRSGTECATVALAQANALGFPIDRPIYFSIDFDPNNLTDAQWLTIGKFFLDVQAVFVKAHGPIGKHRVGVYGGRRALDLIAGDYAYYGWQTYAWSGTPTVWHPYANVRQYDNGNQLCGGLVDFNVSVTEDFGQW